MKQCLIYNYLMSEEEQSFLEDDSSKILALFRKRSLTNHNISLEQYKRLYENLSCTICRSLFHNPVYLRCSHRFCKECIEKYIRLSDKKSCPNCRGGLSTKRDLRSDFMLISMITYAFGNVNEFKAKIDQCQSELRENFKFVKTKSAIECQGKRERTQSQSKDMSNSNKSPQKKNLNPKTFQLEEIAFDSDIKIKKVLSEGENMTDSRSEFQPEWLKTNGRKERKKKEEGSEENKEIMEMQEEAEENNLHQAKSTKQFIKIGQGEEVEKDKLPSQAQISPQKSQSFKEQHQQIEVLQPSIVIQPSLFVQPSSIAPDSDSLSQIVEEENADSETLQAKQILSSYFENEYMKKLISHSKMNCSIKIRLQTCPNSPFTPKLREKFVFISVNSCISDIAKMIAYRLNIENKSVVRIYIRNKESKLEEIMNRKVKMLQINEDFWGSYEGVGILNMKDLLFSLEGKNGRECERLEKVLFYMVSYETLIKK